MTSTPPARPRRPNTETGALPRIDVEPGVQHEPPQPPYLPEIKGDPGSVTGIVPTITEGEDDAKQSDDSAGVKDQAPAGSPAPENETANTSLG